MVRVTHGDNRVQIVRPENPRNPVGGLRSIASLRLSDEVHLWDSTTMKIVVAYPALAEFRIAAKAAGGNDDRRQALLKQVETVIQTLAQHRRRPPRILSCAENNDGIGRVQRVASGLTKDAKTGPDKVTDEKKKDCS